MIKDSGLSSCELYKNRELSWLQFEERILNEARDGSVRPFERLKFLSITGTNLDEFFMIRVATLKDMVHAGYEGKDISGLTAKEQLIEVSKKAHSFVKAQYKVYNDELFPMLSDHNIVLTDDINILSEDAKNEIEKFYDAELHPVLTPIVVDEKRPFPIIRNGYIYLGGFIEKKSTKEKKFALVQLPSNCNRLVPIKGSKKGTEFIFLETIIKYRFNKLFSGYNVGDIATFRVLRNADLTIKEESASDLLALIERQVEERDYGEAIRLEIAGYKDNRIAEYLSNKLSLSLDDIYLLNGPIDFKFLMELYDLEGFGSMRKEVYTPVMPWEFDEEKSLFSQIREHDMMLIHPFESFKPVVDFIKEASTDKDVLAIKQTLYRVSGNSPIVEALIKAAQNGKQVTVLVELKARFDEENNIGWARLLEKAGCNVIYGFASLKTHCKITLVIRREQDGIKRYVHLGTGNYNDTTAKLYTDISFFTASADFGEDATNVFNMLSGDVEAEDFKKMSLAPRHLRDKFIELIEREAKMAKSGAPTHIVAKINSLCDEAIIDSLYEASKAGVKIDLIVRGICCLKPGIKGVSDNITVRSIVGNFLEHSRIFYFKNGGNPEYYCASADWMPRNMDRRIEILFPVERGRLREKLNHVLKLMLKDNLKAWILQPDGEYMRMPDEHSLYSFQDGFCDEEKELTGHKEKN